MEKQGAQNRPAIGILYPGEMGSSLGRLLAEDGFPVVTTLEGRGPRTRRHCTEAGLEVLPTARDVAAAAEVVVSLVSPAAALPVAEAYVALVEGSPRPPLYVDANSISPATAGRIDALLRRSRIDFVDAAIRGPASQLRRMGTLYLSGASAPGVAEWLAPSLQTRVVGESAGAASALKMALSGVSKGLAALFMEMSLVACELDLLDAFRDDCRRYYPGLMEAVERMVPTYPRHSRRREEELRELEAMMRRLEIQPCTARGARQFVAALAELNLAERENDRDPLAWIEVIRETHARGLLHPAAEPAEP